MKFEKYTQKILEEAIKQSLSVSAVLRNLGIPYTSSNHRHIKSRILFYKLDTSHFLGKKSNSGVNRKGGAERLKPEIIFVLDRNNGRREDSKALKKMLLFIGVEEKCSQCKIGPEWDGKKLVLQIDHMNGNGLDNRVENLRFLCPNCHSQTDNFGVKNSKMYLDKENIKKVKILPSSEINPNWRNEPRPNSRKVERPSKEELEKLLWEKPTSQLAVQFGVSDKAIEKWAKKYEISKPPRGYWIKLKEENNKKL